MAVEMGGGELCVGLEVFGVNADWGSQDSWGRHIPVLAGESEQPPFPKPKFHVEIIYKTINTVVGDGKAKNSSTSARLNLPQHTPSPVRLSRRKRFAGELS